jgi:hypothetical protein
MAVTNKKKFHNDTRLSKSQSFDTDDKLGCLSLVSISDQYKHSSLYVLNGNDKESFIAMALTY